MSDNQLTLAVAGSRKTQSIVEACVAAPPQARTLVLTYTTANQDELRRRIASQAGLRPAIDVMGWFTFLIRHFVKPALPFVYPDARVAGFDFESKPQQYTTNEAYERYFNSEAQVRRVHLAQLATRIADASMNAAVKCLSRIYDVIYIDEAQDLCGYDLEILLRLMKAPIALRMVGDVRQAVLLTNEREKKHKRYQYMKIWDWFREQHKKGHLHIEQRAETWRCRQEIASFADSLFDPSWEFAPTTSVNTTSTDHDGLFLVREVDVSAYLERFKPLLLRQSANSARNKPYNFMNFRVSKGLSRPRVMIWPTGHICQFLRSGTQLADRTAAEFYVAITRAEQSVAIVLDTLGTSLIPYWRP
jgi:DNA helicase-2/ATP-dependent DNA helicase PcrA